MTEHYPRIRLHVQNNLILVREGLSLCFYMQRPSDEVAPKVMASLDAYLRAVGRESLGIYADVEGYWQPLDDASWAEIRRGLVEGPDFYTHLAEGVPRSERFRFEYRKTASRDAEPETYFWRHYPNAVNMVRFWLPTEYLEEHGPERVRALALELAEPLPFCTGHVGLSFNGGVLATEELRKICFRYPGIEIIDFDTACLEIGARVHGVAWLTFLGQPLLGELGGVERLRSRLHEPGTTVEPMSGERAVITLGPWPEAGDTEKGVMPPAYRELARVLAPWLYHRKESFSGFSPEDMRRWENRFLD